MTTTFCGLDFGTSNSTIGVVTDGRARLCPLENRHPTLPSAIFFDFEDDAVLFGRAAIATYIDGAEGRLLRALKSLLGSSLIDDKTLIKNRRIPLASVIGMLIGHLKARAEADLGRPIDSVVAGRPVRFVDNDDEADRNAQDKLDSILRAQGFRHVEFLYESVAAALNHEATLDHEQLVMVVDLGGGTSDFTIARLSPDRAKATDRSGDILGNSGVHVGGTDFDRLLSVAEVMPHLGHRAEIGEKKLHVPNWFFQHLATWHRIPALYTSDNLNFLRSMRAMAKDQTLIQRLIDVFDNRDGHRIAESVEHAKVSLSEAPTATIDLPVDGGIALEVFREGFEDAITEALDRIEKGIGACLASAGIDGKDIQAVFLTGGSGAIPAVRRRIQATLPHAQLIEGEAFGSVGTGLAIEAGRRFGA